MNNSVAIVENFLTLITLRLEQLGITPKNIQVSEIGSIHMVGIFDSLESDIITESISMGMSEKFETALVKAFVERTERIAFASGNRDKIKACLTLRSDGFAGFPVEFEDARDQVRKNAYYEAVERYVWSNWWDDPQVEFEVVEKSLDSFRPEVSSMLSKLNGLLPISKLICVRPFFHSTLGTIQIYFAYLKNGGVISGGAAGDVENEHEICLRALSELTRHGLAVRKIREFGILPKTFYEKRLAYFGLSLNGAQTLEHRLSLKGNEAIVLPELEFDEEIPHELDDLIYVHRCLFQNQPPFVGGELERFCL